MPVASYSSFLGPFQFGLSCVLGFVLNFSTYWCTHVNSALTTTVIGCLKNVLSTYVGMVLGGDYVYTLANFMGVNISVIGSLVYSVVKYYEQVKKKNFFFFLRVNIFLFLQPGKSDKLSVPAKQQLDGGKDGESSS